MKFIKIFLASSIVEFQNERQQMGNFIRSLNDTYVKRGLYFELIICEDLSESVALERKQQEYNDNIRESQYFYILLGRTAGQYTIEEFYVALEQFKKSGEPRIFTYFKKLPEGEAAEQSVMDFMEQLSTRIGHYYSNFTHLDAVKLNLLLELVKNPEISDPMKFEDGQVVLGEQPMMSLEHVPLYKENKNVQQLMREQEHLNEEFGRLAVEYGKHPEDGELLKQMMNLGERRSRVRDSLHQMEMDMFGLYSQVEEKRQAGKHLNWREKKAIEQVDLGDYEGAKNILRDAQWEQEVTQAEKMMAAAVEPIREYISGKRSLISTLQAGGSSPETREEIRAIYERCCGLAEKYQIEMNILCDYAIFLKKQREYVRGIQVARKLEQYYEQNLKAPEADRAVLLFILGVLYGENRDLHRAEQVLRKAVALYRRITSENPGKHRVNFAKCINSLAVNLHYLNQMEEEETLYRESLELWRRLAEENPSRHGSDLALVCDNLAILMQIRNRFSEAENLYKEALEIRRGLVRTQADRLGVPGAELAKSCDHMANLMTRINQLDRAESLYRESLEIWLKLAQMDPAVYSVDLACSYRDLSGFMRKKNQPAEAEEMYQKAIEIYRQLAQTNPAAYEPDLAKSCENLAFVYFQVYRLAEAERLYRETLEIYRRLAEGNQEAYEAGLAGCCVRLADVLHARKQGGSEKKKLYEEGIAIYRRLAEKAPEVYEADVASSCSGLALLLQGDRQLEESERLQRKSLEIRERLAMVNPEAYEPYVAESCNRLANLLSEQNKFLEAETLYCRALEIRRRLMQVSPAAYKMETARNCHDLGVFYKGRGQKEKAEALYREAREIYYQLSKAYPGSYDVYLSPASFNLAVLLKSMGKKEEAILFGREALAADRRMAAANPDIYGEYPAETGDFLAELLYDQDREEAEELYREALEIYEGRPGREGEAERIRNILRENNRFY